MLIPSGPRHTFFRIVAAATLAGVLITSFLPSDSVDPYRVDVGTPLDVGHLLAYALLAVATMLSVPRESLTLWRCAGIAFAISLLGVVIELFQPLAGRTTSIVDFAGNEIGIASGIMILCGYLRVERVMAGSHSGPVGDE